MNRRVFLAGAVFPWVRPAIASIDYPHVLPGYRFSFPRDRGSHADFRTEWWYLTGWVQDSYKRQFGVQITFFRNRPRVAEDNASRFAPRQLLFAHAAVADPTLGRLRRGERAARAGLGLAECSAQTTDVWIDDWSLRIADGRYAALIATEDFQFDLSFSPTQPVLAEGDSGYSRKGPEVLQASYYYSEPHLAVEGALATGGRPTKVSGEAWLDHEWSSEYLPQQAVGWDWMGINLYDGGALMAFAMRDRFGSQFWAGGTQRLGGSAPTSYQAADVRFVPERTWQSPRTQIRYPVSMRVRVGSQEYLLLPFIDDQEFDSRATTGTIYWEGAVLATQEGRRVGQGYLELTGYGEPLTL